MARSINRADPMAIAARVGLWPLRLVWFLSPLAVGFGLGSAIDRFEAPGPLVAEGFLWATWFVGLVATLAPSDIGLTAIRALTVGLAGIGFVAGVASGSWAGPIVTIAYGLLTIAVCYQPVVGDRMVNGLAYGSERRMTLRPPAFALLGPVQLAWLVLFAGAVIGPFLLAAGRYILGSIALVVGAIAVWLGGRVLHQLSRRWIVFVPAGFVIHDHVVPVESILLRRSIVSNLGAAVVPLAEEAVDLTGGAAGLSLEVTLDEPVVFGRRIDRQVVNTEAGRLVFTPTLPGAVLTEARTRAIKIGTAETESSPAHDPTRDDEAFTDEGRQPS